VPYRTGNVQAAIQKPSPNIARSRKSGIAGAENDLKNTQQGIWLERSLDGGGVKDELDGLGWVALVNLQPTR
jgi:hypothetical protein